MTDTVKKLMELADDYAMSSIQYGIFSNERGDAKDALKAELTRLFTTTHPAPEGFYQQSVADMILSSPPPAEVPMLSPSEREAIVAEAESLYSLDTSASWRKALIVATEIAVRRKAGL